MSLLKLLVWILLLGLLLTMIGALAIGATAFVQANRADSWCMQHVPPKANGWEVRFGLVPPHFECVYTRSRGERPIIEVSRRRAFH